MVGRDTKVRAEHRDLMGDRDRKGCRGHQVPKGRRAVRGHREIKETKARREAKGLLVPADQPALPAQEGRRARREMWVLRVPKERPGTPEAQVILVPKARRVFRVFRATQARKGRRATLATKAIRARPAIKGRRALLEIRETPVPSVQMGLRESAGVKDKPWLLGPIAAMTTVIWTGVFWPNQPVIVAAHEF